jgi:uncharacterized protein YdcH (DUF465 family)
VEVSPLKLSPGGLLSISASATDACYTGPQTGQSRVASFRIVSPEELFREILVRQQGERAKFRRVIEQSQGLRDQINTLVSQEAASQVARQHRLVQREVFRIQNSLTEALTEMRLNALGSPEAYDLMERNIIAPMKSMHDVEMSQQRDLLDSLGKADSAGQLADASNRQEQLISKMQDILKQMSQWDSFVDVLNQLNEIIKLETQVKTTTDDMQKKQTESIFDR